MGEPIRPDRKAPDQKFCVWIETNDGHEHRVPFDFDSETDATTAATELSKRDDVTVIDRIIVYDELGEFR